MKCKNCNIELSNDNSFCPSCGKNITELQSLGLIEQKEAININQDMVGQNFNDGIQPDTSIENLNNNVEPDIYAQTLSNNYQPENIGETLNNSVEQSYQSFNEIQSAAPDPNLNNLSEPEISYQNQNNNVESQNSYQSVYHEDKPQKNYPWVTIIMVILLFIFLAGGGIFFSKILIKPTAKQIFNTAIDKSFLNCTNLLNNNNDLINGKFSLKTNIIEDNTDNTQTTQSIIFNILNNILISAEYGIDYKNKVALVSFNSTYENNELLKGDLYFNNNKGYLLLNNVYDKYLSTDIEDYDDIFTRFKYTNDHEIVIEEIQKAMTSSLKDEYFMKEESNGITTSILYLDNKNSSALIKDIFTYLNNSNIFKSSLSIILNTEEKEINDYLKAVLDEVNEPSTATEIIKILISIDNKTKEFTKFEIIIAETDSEEKIIITKNASNNYDYQYYLDAKEVYSGNVIIKSEGENTNIKFSITMELYTVGLDINYSIKYNEVIKELDVSNSIDYNTLTETDYNIMYENIMKNEGFKKIMSITELFYYNNKSRIVNNTLCSQAYNCQEGLNGMMDCNYLDTNDGIEKTVQCPAENNNVIQ